MIVMAQTNNIEKFGVLPEETSFKVLNSPKVFRALTSNLYSDKVKAVLSEICANAFDAHVMVGKETIPFEVDLPTMFSPVFTVRDFGPGMSLAFMLKDYTTAFLSTKDTSNFYQGEKGVGRLALISICDNYLISSFQNGVRNNYSVYLNESGIPSIVHLGEEITNESDGIFIEAPIDPNLCNEFETKAKQIFKYYQTKPIIKNREDIIIENNKYIIESADKSFALAGRYNKPLAIMGTYAYPIEINSIPNLNNFQQNLLECGLVCRFNIGDIHTQTNREGLEYDKFTIKSLKDKLDLIVPQVKSLIVGEFTNKSGLEKIYLMKDLLDYNGKLNSIQSLVSEATKDLKVESNLNFEDFEVETFDCYGFDGLRKDKSSWVEINNRMVFFYCDVKGNRRERAKKFFEDSNNHHKSLVFIRSKIGSDVDAAIAKFKNKYDIDISNFAKASTLPFDPAIKNNNRRYKTMVYSHNRWNLQDCWKEETLDPNDEIVYVERSGYYISEFNNNGRYVKSFGDKIESLQKLTGKKFKIYGLTQSELKNKQSHWRDFFEYLKEEQEKWVSAQQDLVGTFNYYNKYYNKFPDDLIAKLTLDKNSILSKINDEYHAIEEKLKDFDASLNNDTKTISSDLNYSTASIYERYPLLEAIYVYNLTDESIADLNEYIKNKDSANITVDNS